MAIPVHATLQGFPELMTALKKEINEIKRGTMKGLLMTAIRIRRSTENEPPLTPVDLGNLRASFTIITAFGDVTPPEFKSGIFRNKGAGDTSTLSSGTKDIAGKMGARHSAIKAAYISKAQSYKTRGIVSLGYTAFYAWYVHENIDAKFYRPENEGKMGRKGRKSACATVGRAGEIGRAHV